MARLEELARGTFWSELGCEVVYANAEKAAIRLHAEQRHLNLIGIVHGGVLMSMLDNAMGLVVMVACREKTVTAQLNTHFLESSRSGILVCEAEIIHRIGRTITLQATVKDEDEKFIAWGSGSYRIVSR
nr:PaaI family thioesterase [Paenibacillus lupini]